MREWPNADIAKHSNHDYAALTDGVCQIVCVSCMVERKMPSSVSLSSCIVRRPQMITCSRFVFRIVTIARLVGLGLSSPSLAMSMCVRLTNGIFSLPHLMNGRKTKGNVSAGSAWKKSRHNIYLDRSTFATATTWTSKTLIPSWMP